MRSGRGAPGKNVALSPFLRTSLGVMAAAPLALVLRPSWWPYIGGVVLGNHAVAAAAGMMPRSRLLGPNLSSLSRDDAVALTFDDGPDPNVTPEVLDVLDQHGARASFFCVGRCAERWPDVVREIASRGHLVENHTTTHSNFFGFMGLRSLAREVDGAQKLLEQLTGRPPRLFRAPAGIRGPLLQPVLAKRNLLLASWTRRGFDAVSRDPEAIYSRLAAGLGGGDVILLHDGQLGRGQLGRSQPGRKQLGRLDRESSARARPTLPVLDVLPRLLEELNRLELRGVPMEIAAAAPS